MFAKLFKLEVRETAPTLILGLLAQLLVVGISGVLMLETSGVVNSLAAVTGFLFALVTPFALYIWISVRYWQTMYGSRAYFTHTLPASGGVILGVKTLWMMIYMTATTLCGALSLWWMIQIDGLIATGESGTTSAEYWRALADRIMVIPEWLSGMVIVTALIGGLVVILQTVLFIVVGTALSNWRALDSLSGGVSLGLGLGGVYLIYQAANALSIIGVPLGLSYWQSNASLWHWKLEVGQVFNWTDRGFGDNYVLGITLPLGLVVVVPLLFAFGYWFAHRMTVHHLNLR